MLNIRTLARVLALSAGLLVAGAASADDILIVNARLFDAVDGAIREGVTVTVKDGRIETVGAAPAEPGTARVIDAGGRTLMPGLINGHLHLFFDFYGPAPFTPGSEVAVRDYQASPLPDQLRGHLEHGFTSILSPIDFLPQIAEVREQLANGELVGPRLTMAGGVLMHPGGHYACRSLEGEAKTWCDANIGQVMTDTVTARDAVRRYAEAGVDVIVYDGLTNDPAFDPALVSAMVDEAHQRNLRVLVHNIDARYAAGLVEAGVDGFIHPPTRTRDVDGTLLSSVGAREVPLAVTLGASERNIRLGRASPASMEAYETSRRNVLSLLEAGAVPVFASDLPGIPPQEVVPMVIGVLKGVGLDNRQILLAATRDAARGMLGRNDLGTVEAGQVADLILVDGDPLADIEALNRVVLVIKGGEVVVEHNIAQEARD